MEIVKAPCWNYIEKKDCPNRKVGCHATCEKWTEYAKAQAKVYSARKGCSQAHELTTFRRHTLYLKYLKKGVR